MLRSLSLDHFRSFSSESVKLGDLTFLVGQNGTGKSNFVDVFSFIAEAMESSLLAVFRRRGGFETVVHTPHVLVVHIHGSGTWVR